MCTFIVAYVSLAIPTVNIEGGEKADSVTESTVTVHLNGNCPTLAMLCIHPKL